VVKGKEEFVRVVGWLVTVEKEGCLVSYGGEGRLLGW
jgi:hypothetical protein